MNPGWLSHFLETLARLSAQAAVLVLMVLLAQWLFRRWLTPRWRCALWWLVIGRLLLPVSLPTQVSVFNLTPATIRGMRSLSGHGAGAAGIGSRSSAAVRPQTEGVTAPPAERALVPDFETSRIRTTPGGAGQDEPGDTPAPGTGLKEAKGRTPAVGSGSERGWRFSWPHALFAAWLSGAVALALYVVVHSIRATRRFRGLPEVTDAAVLAVLNECRERIGVSPRLRLVEGANLRSPALHGVFRPRLLLPAGFTRTFSLAELHYVFLHELAHVKRRDVLMNWVVALLTVVHWFNPLVWYGFARWRADRELACDALALETAGERRNQEYGRTILRLLEGFSHRVAAPGLVGILEDKRQLQQRIGMIAMFVPARRWSLPAMALLAGLALLGLTDAQDKNLKTDQRKAVGSRAAGSPELTPAAAGAERPARPAVTNGAAMKVMVLDAENNQPLAKAEVFAPNHASFFGQAGNPPRWTTDSSGLAVIHLGQVQPGHLQQMSWFTLSVRHHGYASRGFSWSADNKDVRPEMPAQITVRLQRGLKAGGIVQDEQGRPLAGVRVRLFGAGYWRGMRHEYPEFWNHPDDSPILTDAAGRWAVAGFPSDLDLIRMDLIRPDGSSEHFVQEGEADPRERGEPVNLTDLRGAKAFFVLKDGLTARGQVLDPEGKPLSGVLIKTGTGFGNSKSVGEMRTDAAGRFEFRHLSPCQLIMTACPTNFAITSIIVDITANMPEIRLPVAALRPLRLHLTDGDGKPMAGVAIGVEKYRSEGQVLDFAGITDPNGQLTWTNAPVSTFALMAVPRPDWRQKIAVTPGQRDVTVRLRDGAAQEIVVKGRATDARTGAEVRVESVHFQTGDHEGFKWPGEISEAGFQVSVPATRFRPGGTYPSFQLQLQAKGYATLITPWRDFDLGDWTSDFVLEPAAAAARTVLLPDGAPAAGARVWVRADQNDPTLFCNSPNRYYGDRMVLEQADGDGQFLLPTVPENQAVVLTHANGFLATTMAEIRKVRELRLRAWGTVEGQVTSAGQPRAGVRVNLTTLLWSPAMGYHLTYNTATGPDGRFVFTNVPEGEYKMYRWIGSSRAGRTITESHQLPILVRAGETLQVPYGGSGRAVIGQATSDKPDQTVDWQHDDHVLILKQAPVPAVNSADFAIAADFTKAYQASFQAPAKLKQVREARTYQLEFEQDGSFRADDVPPGTYELRIRITNPNQSSPRRFSFNSNPDDELGSLVREVIVPPGHDALDLGRLVVSMKEDPALKRGAPVELTARTLDGKTFLLEQRKGKYTLLTFWASWSERSTEQLAELNKLETEWKRDERLGFLSVNLDDDPAAARQASATLGPRWQLAHLDERARVEVTARFNVDSLPSVFLLDPDNRIVGRDLEGDRVRAAVERALKSNQPKSP